MECFAHPGSDAVGICKTCGKAVCRDCVVDTGFAIACSESCASEATALHQMNQAGKRLYGIGVDRKKLPSGIVMWLLFGTLFSGYGVFEFMQDSGLQWFPSLFGAASFLVAWIGYRRAKDVGLQC